VVSISEIWSNKVRKRESDIISLLLVQLAKGKKKESLLDSGVEIPIAKEVPVFSHYCLLKIRVSLGGGGNAFNETIEENSRVKREKKRI